MFPSCLYLCDTSLQLKLWRNETFQMRIKQPRDINISEEGAILFQKALSFQTCPPYWEGRQSRRKGFLLNLEMPGIVKKYFSREWKSATKCMKLGGSMTNSDDVWRWRNIFYGWERIGGRMRISVYIRSFMHLENAWQAQSTEKECFSHGDLIVTLWKHDRLLEKDGSLSQYQI